jgi:transposase
MIDPDKRNAIYYLHNEGIGIREISRQLKVSRNTVRAVIDENGSMPDLTRKDRIEIDPQLLRRLYNECNGWIQRTHEKLTEEEGVKIGYSTLTRMIRELDLGQPRKKRCARVPDEPGAEMQHDTSPYILKIGDKKVKVVASIIYFRYSKIRYLKFYRSFDRFKMKCFFHEALTFFGWIAQFCIIDNTNLARLRGTGKDAVIVPEMEKFGRQYGFDFICHEKGHANRKAGNERSFYTVETNFFPGRKFDSLEDLNQQAFDWSTVRMANRPVSKTGLIPAKAFEFEQSYLIKLPPYVAPPYLVHQRDTDQYGYASFDGNFYWVPGTSRDNVKVLQYSDCLKIYLKRKLLANYKLPPDGVKNQLFSPPGEPRPLYRPKYRKKPTALEEKKLRTAAKEVDAYLNFALKQNQNGKQKHRFIRQLYWLYQKITLPLFIKTLKRALKYRITDIETIERIASLQLRDGSYPLQSVNTNINEDFQNRESYLEGRLNSEVDLSIYDQMMEDED